MTDPTHVYPGAQMHSGTATREFRRTAFEDVCLDEMLAAQAAFVPPAATEENIRRAIEDACAQAQAAFAPHWISQPEVDSAGVAGETVSSLAAFSPPTDVRPPPTIGEVSFPHAAPVELFYVTSGAEAPTPLPPPPALKARYALHRNLQQIAIEEAATRQRNAPIFENIAKHLEQSKFPSPLPVTVTFGDSLPVNVVNARDIGKTTTTGGRPPRKQARKRARKRAARPRTP